jgi:hypothetical protein
MGPTTLSIDSLQRDGEPKQETRCPDAALLDCDEPHDPR